MYFQYVLEAGCIFFEIGLPVTKFNPNILRKIVGPLSCFPKLNDRLSLSDPHSLFAGGGDLKNSVHYELYMVG